MRIGKIPVLTRRRLAVHKTQGAASRKMRARRDAALIVVISIAAAIICVKLDLSEALLRWTRLHERLQLDELPAWLLAPVKRALAPLMAAALL